MFIKFQRSFNKLQLDFCCTYVLNWYMEINRSLCGISVTHTNKPSSRYTKWPGSYFLHARVGHVSNFPNRFNIQNVSLSDTTLVYFYINVNTPGEKDISLLKLKVGREEKKPFAKCSRNLSIKLLSPPSHFAAVA